MTPMPPSEAESAATIDRLASMPRSRPPSMASIWAANSAEALADAERAALMAALAAIDADTSMLAMALKSICAANDARSAAEPLNCMLIPSAACAEIRAPNIPISPPAKLAEKVNDGMSRLATAEMSADNDPRPPPTGKPSEAEAERKALRAAEADIDAEAEADKLAAAASVAEALAFRLA